MPRQYHETALGRKYPLRKILPPSPAAAHALGVISVRSASATPNGTRSTERHCVITSSGRVNVFDGGFRWSPAQPIPRDAQPNAAQALAKNADGFEKHGRAQASNWRAA